MEQSLLSLVRSAIKHGYLPCNWHKTKEQIIETYNGNLSLITICVEAEGAWFHEELDNEKYVYDQNCKCYIREENSIIIFTSRYDCYYAHKDYVNNYYQFNGNHYTLEGLADNDLVVMVDDTIARQEDVYYWDADDGYHFEPEPGTLSDEEDEDNENDFDIWEYHDGPCPPDYRVTSNDPGIGFEIEKGGNPAFCGRFTKERLYDKTGCVMEEDGTVDWELKTPIYPLFSQDIEHLWLPEIEEAINATNHENAGGHIHLSKYPKTGAQLFDFCRPYFPLFMAMYPKRLEKDYCIGKTESKLKLDADKHQAIKIWNDRIELRFPAKVHNMKAILFRLKFCRLMIEREYNNILSVTLAAFDPDTRLGALVAEVYAGKESMLLNRLIEVTRKYFNTVLDNEKAVHSLLHNLKKKKQCA